MSIDFLNDNDLNPKIIVFGVGGAGGNAVNNMVLSGLEGVEFWIANTDSQALKHSITPAENKIQLGINCTKGLGAGSNPDIGNKAAEESIEQIKSALQNCNMLFITAGMGGGTGTGAAPVIAKVAKELGILTVGVVTKPFHFEGARRLKVAEIGLEEMSKYIDTLIVIPNQNLFHIANEKTTFADAFKMADMVLDAGVRSITDLITMPGIINLDFADIRTVMTGMGKAMIGIGEAEGEDRAIRATQAALSNPLLDNSSMRGARGVIINITGFTDLTLYELDEAANKIKEVVDSQANIIFGSAFNPDLAGKIKVSVVATGIEPIVQTEHKVEIDESPKPIKKDKNQSNIDSIKNGREAFIPPAVVEVDNYDDIPPQETHENKSIFSKIANFTKFKSNPETSKKEDILDIPTFLRKNLKENDE